MTTKGGTSLHLVKSVQSDTEKHGVADFRVLNCINESK